MESYVVIHKNAPDIKHWGIPGMRWGIRRYQNPDGTLTDLGKEHYGRGGKANSKLEKAIKATAKKMDQAAANKRAANNYLVRPVQDFQTRQYMIGQYYKSHDKVNKNEKLIKDLMTIRGEKSEPKNSVDQKDNEYSDERTVLKKGTILNSVSDKYVDSETYKKNAPVLYTYKDSEEWDNTVYKGPYSTYLVKYRGAQFIREHKFRTVKDLLMPTKQQRVDNFKEMLNDKSTIKDLETIKKYIVDNNINGMGGQKFVDDVKRLDVRNISTPQELETAYGMFNHALENVGKYSSAGKYLKKMASQYDAMSDDNNRGVYNRAVDPIIVFKAAKTLETYGDINVKDFLVGKDIVDKTNEVRKKLGSVAL